jgi:hypothetical protein
MKRLLFTVWSATLVFTACADRNGSKVTGRSITDKVAAGEAAKKATEGSFASPDAKISNTKKMTPGSAGRRALMVAKSPVVTSFRCVRNVQTQETSPSASDALIKIQGGSQLIVGQDTGHELPTGESSDVKDDTVKEVLNLMCVKDSVRSGMMGLMAKPTRAAITVNPLMSGEKIELKIKLDTLDNNAAKSVRILCMDREKMNTADQSLFQNTNEGSDFILATGSVILMTAEVGSSVGVTCEVDPNVQKPVAPKAPNTPVAPPVPKPPVDDNTEN